MDRANAIIVCIMISAWIHIILSTSLKRFGTIRQKILHCDLLHCFMFHDKKSCRKTMFLSFIVGGVSFVCITFGFWMRLDLVNIRDFFERFQDYQAKHDIIFLEPVPRGMNH